MKRQYAKPNLVFYGNVEDITRADESDIDTDGVFYNGTQVGTQTGSSDLCFNVGDDDWSSGCE